MNRFSLLALLLTVWIGLVVTKEAQAQNKGLIYGTITTVDNETYTGQIRWGKEEALWTDHLNVGQFENENLKLMSREDMDAMADSRESGTVSSTSFMGFTISKRSVYWSSGGSPKYLHKFVCRFGDVDKIRVTGRNKMDVMLRNGEVIEADGSGYNDVGTDIRISDAELGMFTLDWDRVESVDFQEAPEGFESQMGQPLYGEVKTTRGSFTGFVQWDNDERLSDDLLDGDSDDGRMKIPFEKISSIENKGSKSQVTMQSGRSMTLSGTNDVNSSNKGINVTQTNGLRLHIPWEEFETVTFSKAPQPMAYSDFATPKKLSGKVTTVEGESVNGTLHYDLDERYSFEILHGTKDDIEYLIPMSLVKSIKPRNHAYTNVELRGGEKLLLGEEQDVTDRNHGILILKGSDESTYVAWEKVESISLN